MKPLLTFIALIFLSITFVNLSADDNMDRNEKFKKLLYDNHVQNLLNHDKQFKLFLIISDRNCLGCNISKISGILNTVKDTYPNAWTTLIIDTYHEGDSKFMKRKLKLLDTLIEDTKNKYTKHFDAPIAVFIEDQKRKQYFYTCSDYQEAQDFTYHHIPAKSTIQKGKTIIEPDDISLSNINLLSASDSLLKLYDIPNSIVLDYHLLDNTSKVHEVPSYYEIARKNCNIIDSMLNSGLELTELICKAIESPANNINILYGMVIDSFRYNDDGLNGKLTSSIACFNNDGLKLNGKIKGDNYIDFYFDRDRYYFLVEGIPNMQADSNCLFFSLNTNLTDYRSEMTAETYSKLVDDSSRLSDFQYFAFENSDTYGWTNPKAKAFYYYNNKIINKIDLKEAHNLFAYYDLLELKIIKDKLLLIMGNEVNTCIQIYDLPHNTLLNYERYTNNDDYLISSKFISFKDNQLTLLNRRKLSRWSVERIPINFQN